MRIQRVPDDGRRPSSSALVLACGVVVLIAMPTAASGQAEDLWDATASIELRIAADFRQIRTGDRLPGAPWRHASISVGDDTVATPAFVRTRGNFRLRRSTCAFPPLRLRIATDSVRPRDIPPALRGLGNARLVSVCRNGQEDLVSLEYLAYRIYDIVSDVGGYAVRPARVTFVDSTGRDGTRTSAAFLLEGDGHLSRRLDLTPVPDSVTGSVDPRLLEPANGALIDAFQYLIGNTDWSVAGRHNILVAQRATGRYVGIPFDFDFSGLVDAPYAAPDPRLRLSRVTDRIFRGICRSDAELAAAIATIADRRGQILAELDSLEGASGGRRSRARRFLEDFFVDAASGRALAAFRRTCR